MNRRARKLAIRQRDAVLPARLAHHAQVILADLVSEAARAAVDHHRDLVLRQSERVRDALVVDFGDVLQLGEVIARSERAELRPAPFLRAIRDQFRIRVRQAAAFFDVIEVRRVAEPARDRPRGAAREDLTEILAGEAEIAPVRADAGRHVPVHLGDDRFQMRDDVGAAQT